MIDDREFTSTKINRLGTDKVSKLIMSFFSTSLVGLLLNSIYNLTDTLFISWGVGDFAMGGVAVVAPFMFLQGAISTMIGGGASTLISLKLGEGKPNEAGKITINAMAIFYAIAIIITALGFIFFNPLLKIMGASSEILPYAKEYFAIMLIGNIFSTGFSSIMRAEGKNLYSMFTWATTIVINIVLDAIFILVLKWGVRGAAAATVLGQVVGVMISAFFFLKVSSQKFKGARICGKTIASILKIGVPSLVQMGSFSIIVALSNLILSKYSGAIAVVIFGYVSKLLFFAIAPFTAISHAIAPVVGYNHGRGSMDRVSASVKFSVIIALIYAVFILIIAESIPKYLMMIFTRDVSIIEQGSVTLRIIALSLLFMPMPMVMGTKLQSVGNKLWSIIFYSSNAIFIVLPAVFLGKEYGLKGLAGAFIIANFLSCMLVLVKFIIDKIKSKEQSSTTHDLIEK